MAHRSVEESFREIAPKRRGVPTPVVNVGVSGTGDGFSGTMSQAAQEITQLRADYQKQADLIAANTQALQNNTSAKGSVQSIAGTVGHAASSFLARANSAADHLGNSEAVWRRVRSTARTFAVVCAAGSDSD